MLRTRAGRRGAGRGLRTHEPAGAWSLDEGEKGKAKILNMFLRDVLLLGDSPWREAVTHRERDTEGWGL